MRIKACYNCVFENSVSEIFWFVFKYNHISSATLSTKTHKQTCTHTDNLLVNYYASILLWI